MAYIHTDTPIKAPFTLSTNSIRIGRKMGERPIGNQRVRERLTGLGGT